jgi:pyruvate-formate lyase
MQTFEQLRDHLYDQFTAPPYEEASGLTGDALKAKIAGFEAKNLTMPRVLLKANVFRIVVTEARICVDPKDWFVDKLEHGGLIRKMTASWLDEAVRGPIAREAGALQKAYDVGLLKGPRGGLDLGHISPGWEHLLRGGLKGLLREIETVRSSDTRLESEQVDFLRAVEIVYRAAIDLSQRYANMCDQIALTLPEDSERLRTIAAVCRQVPAERPRSFHEALQFTLLVHELIEMEGEFVRSMGQFDRALYPFYRADIDSGILNRREAKELIKFYWMKWYSRTRGERNGKNFVFGGQYPDGSLITNELTYVALEAYEELNTPDPKLSVRFNPEEKDELYVTVADLIRKGHNSFVLLNDPVAVRALERMGKTSEDARTYLPIGCYEPAVEGREAACTMNVTVNFAKIVELTLNNGLDPLTGEMFGAGDGGITQFGSFEGLWSGFVSRLEETLEMAIQCIRAAEGQWPNINPSPFIAGTIEDCISSAKDIGQGGARYNSVGFVGAGLANAADSLMSIRQAVYETGTYTLADIVAALRNNFAGDEPMRRYLLDQVPKWGNDVSEVDAIGRSIAEHYCNKVHSFTNARGGRCQAALFTLDFAWHGGRRTGALPDGRRSGESLAPGTGASYGRDKNGATGLLKSVLNLDAENLPNGSVLDVTLHPSSVAGDKGLESLVDLIKTYFAGGGYGLQFNVYDAETLRSAQRNPEKFSSLQVRLTGWSVYFTSLSAFEQEQFIKRVSHNRT